MGTDIHWMIERQHQDGAWEAVNSEDYIREILRGGFDLLEDEHPVVQFGCRDYDRFSMLSNTPSKVHGRLLPLAYPGMPHDISTHAQLFYGAAGDQSDDMHFEGSFTLGRLRRAVAQCDKSILPSDEHVIVARTYLATLEALLSGPMAIALNQILIGRTETDDFSEFYPEMAALSNHEKLELKQRCLGLLPITDDTLRVLIAYDS